MTTDWLTEGKTAHQVGDLVTARSAYDRVISADPQHAEALNYLGYTYIVRGSRLQDAGRYLKRALQLKPDNGYIVDSWGWYLFSVGKVREAVTQLELAARLKPDEPTVLEHLGDAYVRTGFAERAMRLYAEAARLSEKDEDRQKLVAKLEALRSELARAGVKIPVVRLPAAQKAE